MPCRYLLNETRFKLPDTLIKEYRIDVEYIDGNKETITVCDNHQRLVYHGVGREVRKVTFTPVSTHGCNEFRLFDFELV
jgi:hypothetical protein